MQQNHSNLAEAIIEVKDFKDGGGTNSLILGKTSLPLIYILFYYYASICIILYLFLYILSMTIVCCSLKIQQWGAASPIAKGRTVSANNRQSKVLNTNFNPWILCANDYKAHPQHSLNIFLFYCSVRTNLDFQLDVLFRW